MAHWIKFELATLDKPEVIRMGRALGLSREAVAGYLMRFWGWFGDNSVDGHVDAVVVADVDMVLSLPGFADAMIAVKWLEFDVARQRLTMPKFDRHNGESSKKRALKASRQARYRDAPVDAVVDAPVDARVAPNVIPEESRGEYIKPKTIAPAALVLPDWIPKEAWNGWIESRRKNKPTLEAKRLSILDLEKLRAAGHDPKSVLEESTKRGWTGLFPLKTDDPKKNGAPAWWTSDAGIEAKAREVGITPQRGETWQQLKGRVQQSLGGSA